MGLGILPREDAEVFTRSSNRQGTSDCPAQLWIAPFCWPVMIPAFRGSLVKWATQLTNPPWLPTSSVHSMTRSEIVQPLGDTMLETQNRNQQWQR